MKIRRLLRNTNTNSLSLTYLSSFTLSLSKKSEIGDGENEKRGEKRGYI